MLSVRQLHSEALMAQKVAREIYRFEGDTLTVMVSRPYQKVEILIVLIGFVEGKEVSVAQGMVWKV